MMKEAEVSARRNEGDEQAADLLGSCFACLLLSVSGLNYVLLNCAAVLVLTEATTSFCNDVIGICVVAH